MAHQPVDGLMTFVGDAAACANGIRICGRDRRTIELKIVELLDEKREVIAQILDGKDPDDDGGSVLGRLIEEMRKEAA